MVCIASPILESSRNLNPGPKKGVNPRENWGKTRAPSQSSQEEDEDDEMAAPEEPSLTDPQYSTSSQQGPTLNTYREIDEFEAAQAQAQAAQTSTSGSSSPQNSPGDTESPLFSPAETQEEAVRQWTPVNRPALVPLVLRTPLPSGPAKRSPTRRIMTLNNLHSNANVAYNVEFAHLLPLGSIALDETL